MTTTGGCLCGAVCFRTEAEPIRARACWCRLCQALGAGGPTYNVAFPTEGFVVEGQTNDYVSKADSGATMHRRFCPLCGTPLFSEAAERPHLIFVRAGALDDPEIAAPIATIWTSSAPSWARFDPDLPQVEGQPPPVA
jgi:hypothetical protein